MHQRTAILSMAAGYGRAQVRAFLKSIEQYSPDTRVQLFASAPSHDLVDFVQSLQCRVELIFPGRFVQKARDYFRRHHKLAVLASCLTTLLPRNSRIREFLFRLILHPSILRYYLYKDWLAENQFKFDCIYFLDARDVLVLRDLSVLTCEKLIIAEEEGRIRDESYNQAWLYRLDFDPVQTLSLFNGKILCSGTMASCPTEAIHLFDRFCQVVNERVGVIGPRGALDQAVINWVVRIERPAGVVVLPLDNSVLVNLGTSSPDDTLSVNLLDRTRLAMPVILHQYDRNPALVRVLSKLLPDVLE